MSFWTLSNGQTPTGAADAAFTKEFGIIPNNTQATAIIKEFSRVDATVNYPFQAYQIIYKITSGEFLDREVKQNVKCFDSKPSIADKAIEMLKRIYDLCNHKPNHGNEPVTQDLQPMVGKTLGIKIREYSIPKDDGNRYQGNFVAEVHKADKDFQTMTGIKLEVPENAATRHPRGTQPELDDSIPF